jgi:hypothetical protein
MITASRVVRELLLKSGLVVADFSKDWCCVLKIMPDGVGVRDNLFAIADIEGALGDRYVSTGEIVMHPHVRIICRTTLYDVGYTKMLQVMDIMDIATNYEVKIENEVISLHKTSRQSGIVSNGLDATMRRYLFSLDYEIVLR